MIVPAELAIRFADVASSLEFVARRVRETLIGYCEDKGYAFVSRVKSLESAAEKIEAGRYSRLSEVTDLFACAVIIPTLSYEDSVLGFLASAFAQDSVKARDSAMKSPEVFRFEATRFIGRLRSPEGTQDDQLTFRLPFEVQVRTAFEHAWSVATHDLAYKAESPNWAHLRLAAQLKAAVEQLDMLAVGYEDALRYVQRHHWPEVEGRVKIVKFFEGALLNSQIPVEAAPKRWAKFGDNVARLIIAGAEGRGDSIRSTVRKAIRLLDQEFASMNESSFPRSLSLLQLVFGILAEKGFVSPPLKGYTPLITPSLTTLYPATKQFLPGFELDKW